MSADAGDVTPEASATQYALDVAGGVAYTSTETWKAAAAASRDVGQLILASVGWTPSSGEPEHDESKIQHETYEPVTPRLKVGL